MPKKTRQRAKRSIADLYALRTRNYPRRREELMVRFLDEFFWKCFSMLAMNRIEGDYLEFGCGSNVRSFRLAYKYKVLEYGRPRLFAFDSFRGLPEPAGIDQHAQWSKGGLAITLTEFRKLMREMGATRKDYHTVPGFYVDTLDGASPADHGIEQAAMVFVDCDLYASTKSVLRYVKDTLVDGSILAFDDWFCFNGDPNKGEQRAFAEFLKANKDIAVSEYLNFGWHGKSFIVHRSAKRIARSGRTKKRPASASKKA